MNKILSVMLFIFISSCTSQIHSKYDPPYNMKPSSVWMRQLNLVIKDNNDLEHFTLKQDNNSLTIQPALSKATVNNKSFKFKSKPIIWHNDIYLSEPCIQQLATALNKSHKKIVVSYHSEWLPSKTAVEVDWKYIVIHHSASNSSCADRIHCAHVAKGYDEMGYHFVIGNGSETANGCVEVGCRWPKQKHGAHARASVGTAEYADNRYNFQGVGICLIGNFMHGEQPSDKQMKKLVELVKYLQKKYKISSENVIPHKTVKATLCPGDNFPWSSFKSKILP